MLSFGWFLFVFRTKYRCGLVVFSSRDWYYRIDASTNGTTNKLSAKKLGDVRRTDATARPRTKNISFRQFKPTEK